MPSRPVPVSAASGRWSAAGCAARNDGRWCCSPTPCGWPGRTATVSSPWPGSRGNRTTARRRRATARRRRTTERRWSYPGNCPPPFRTWPAGRRSWNGSRRWPPTSPQGGRTPPRWWCCTGRRGSARPASPSPLDIDSARPSPADSSSSTCRASHRTARSIRPRRWPDCCGRSGCRTAGCRCRWPSGVACSAPSPGTGRCWWSWTMPQARHRYAHCCRPGGDASRWSPAGVH